MTRRKAGRSVGECVEVEERPPGEITEGGGQEESGKGSGHRGRGVRPGGGAQKSGGRSRGDGTVAAAPTRRREDR